jgi:hypothetical protein
MGAASVLKATPRKVSIATSRLVPCTFVKRWNAVFVCVAALAILDKLDEVNHQTLSWWLAERQLPNGGLNGRPQKLEDVRTPVVADLGPVFLRVAQVCYSFWVLSSMSILNKLTWIDAEKLISFILSAQVRNLVLFRFTRADRQCLYRTLRKAVLQTDRVIWQTSFTHSLESQVRGAPHFWIPTIAQHAVRFVAPWLPGVGRSGSRVLYAC